MPKASRRTDVGARIYAGRRYPGLCESKSCHVDGEDVERFRNREGLKIAHVVCQACGRRWTRIGE